MAFSWSQPISLRGPAGAVGAAGQDGVSFTTTNGKPTVPGRTGEARIDPNTFTIWSWNSSDWIQSQSFAGSVGAVGPADFVGFGDTDPTLQTYSGDAAGIFFQRASGHIWLYTKSNGWYDSNAVTTGPQGPAGTRGSYRYVQPNPPPSDPSTLTPTPMKGDEFVDTSTTTGPNPPYVSYFG